MGERASETILHGVVAATVVLACLRLQGIRSPSTRLRFWLLALACPAVLTPLFWLFAPWRWGETFRDERAIFSASHWMATPWHRLHPGSMLAATMAAAGLALFLRDLLPFVLDVARLRSGKRTIMPAPPILVGAVQRAAQAFGIPAPKLVLWSSAQQILVCRGLFHPRIVVSTGLVQWLAADELEAAVAHEMVHVVWRDPALGWILMLVRGLFFFNPAVQLVARAIVQDIEGRADEAAAHRLGSPHALVRCLSRMADISSPDGEQIDPIVHAHPLPGLSKRVRLATIARRCRHLLAGVQILPKAATHWSLLATGFGLGAILFFTVA
jgi:Zn-dependent protease with chaperone function